MSKERTIQAEIGGYISTILRKYFGKGPTSVFVTINRPFFTIHFRGFLAPMEELQLKQKQEQRVLETRNILMSELKPEIIKGLHEVADLEAKELYVDWNLEKETGLMIGVLEGEPQASAFTAHEGVDAEAFLEKIEQASHKAEKVPGQTDVYWLNDRTILVRRSEILIRIEKALIRNGFAEELKVAKRPLEHEVLREVELEKTLNSRISETFLDWNFETDVSYIVFVLDARKS